MNASTVLCGVIGHPINHSFSPAIHNAGYEALGLNFAYLAFDVTNLKQAVDGMRGLNIKGLSVTVPHKVPALELVDDVEPLAKQIGAINTVVNEEGKLKGFNTDFEGAMRALTEVTTLENKTVVLLGAGGAARAIAFGLQEKKANVTILSRTSKSAEKLANDTGAKVGDFSELEIIKTSDILINATPVGMHPNEPASPVPKEFLHKNLVVFDIVYNPKKTQLIVDAKDAGCSVIYGYKMLLYQAIRQFELFTGVKAPEDVMEEALLKALAI